MANNFRGYLIKAVSSGTVFPNTYIQYDTFQSTPNQREEIKAYRDDNTRDLYRITSEGRKSVVKFTTRDSLTLDEKIEIQNFFYNNESNHVERKIQLEFWNEEDNVYDTGYFYRPNMTFKIKKIEGNNIIYDAFNFELIEY